jgi:hypothetical protein
LASYNGNTYNSSMVFDPAGQWVGEYNQTGGYWWPEYIRLGGRVVAFNSQGTNNTVFLHKDLENTTHMVTEGNGVRYPFLFNKRSRPYGSEPWCQRRWRSLDWKIPSATPGAPKGTVTTFPSFSAGHYAVAEIVPSGAPFR